MVYPAQSADFNPNDLLGEFLQKTRKEKYFISIVEKMAGLCSAVAVVFGLSVANVSLPVVKSCLDCGITKPQS